MACQILLDFSPRTTSLALGDTSSPGAPLGRTQTGTIRQRRWHSRSKDGCITCRNRHLRCDEEKPVCRRCIARRIICGGYDNPSPEKGKPQKSAAKATTPTTAGGQRALQTPPATPPAPSVPSVPSVPAESEASALELFGSAHTHNINIEAEPPDWDLQEGIRYYAQVVLPGRNVEVRRGGGPDFHSKTFRFPRFLSQVIGDQISRASKARGTLLAPGQYPAFAGVWARYSQLLSSSIKVVNDHILDEDPCASWRVLVGIDQLLVLDLYVERSLWQGHLSAFFEYISHKGGITAVLDQPEPPFYCLNHVLTIAINVNTTSPARQQVHGFDDYTDDQLVSILESAYSISMQCPTELYVVMVHISRLRADLAHPGSKPNRRSTEERVRHIFDSIDRFDADNWAAKPEFRDKINTVATLGRIFAVAVRIYGIMTLPPSAVVAWMMAEESEPAPVMSLDMDDAVAMCNTLRIWQREELLALVRQSWGLLRHTTSLCWPLVVAGVAFVDGAAEDQDFIERSLLSIWKLPNTSVCFMTAIKKLRLFWSSGKTGWDDCFDQPLACVV